VLLRGVFVLLFIYCITLQVMEDLYKWINPKTRKHCPMISEETLNVVRKNADVRIYDYSLFITSSIAASQFSRCL
jgi:hypothetical protein